MHDTAMEFGRLFFYTYFKDARDLRIVDIGALDVNGTLRSVAPPGCEYIGMDFAPGKGVDVILTDPYSLPLQDNSVDICVSSSCFEHAEFFWLLFNESMRILKPNGVLYINAPSNGNVHRYPVDCWRFYPDSGVALQNWGRRNGYHTVLLESFTGKQKKDIWNDFIAVFLKDERYTHSYPHRMIHSFPSHTNGLVFGSSDISNTWSLQEDQERLSTRLIKWHLKRQARKIKRLLGRL